LFLKHQLTMRAMIDFLLRAVKALGEQSQTFYERPGLLVCQRIHGLPEHMDLYVCPGERCASTRIPRSAISPSSSLPGRPSPLPNTGNSIKTSSASHSRSTQLLLLG
jgi:hypothetical protein